MFALELAKRGFNLVLISWNTQRLQDTDAKIKSQFSQCKTKIIQADLGECASPDFIDLLEKQTKDLDISILINNAGVMYNENFINLDPLDIVGLINLNCLAPELLTQVFTNWLISHSERTGKRSAIINVDSVAGSGPAPFTAVYSGAKGFLWNLTLAISEELKDHIDVISLAPGPVNTAMSGFLKDASKFDPMTCTTETTVRGWLRDLG